MPVVDELILQLKGEVSDVKKKLDQIEQDAKKTGEKSGKNFADAFGAAVGAITGSAVLGKIVSFFQSSVKSANELETTMAGLRATANITGESFDKLIGSVKKLADGVLSIDQASNAMKQLVAQGMSADKAFQLVDAAKKVGQFGNVVGNTGQAVLDFVKFTQTGSAALSENLDPALLGVVKSLGGYSKVAQDATAKQAFFNAVIEKGNRLTDDYNKSLEGGAAASRNFEQATTELQQAIGEGLSPAFSFVTSLLADFFRWLAEIIKNLSPAAKVIAAIGVTLTALVPTVIAAAGAFKLLGASIGVALGPVTLIVAGIAALTAALTFGVNAYQNSEQAIKRQSEELANLSAKVNKTAQEKQRLAELDKKFGGTDEFLKQLQKQNATIYEQTRALQILREARARSATGVSGRETAIAGMSDADLQRELAARRRSVESVSRAYDRMSARARTAETAALRDRATREADAFARSSQLDTLRTDLALLESEAGRRRPAAGTTGGGGGAAARNAMFFGNQMRKDLEQLQREYADFIARTRLDEQGRQKAFLDFEQKKLEIQKRYEGQIAEFIESEHDRKLRAINEEYEETVANIKLISENTEQEDKKIEAAREAARRKRAEAEAELVKRTFDQANQAASGVSSIASGVQQGGAGGFAQTIGGAGSLISMTGPQGAVIGAGLIGFGAVIGTLSGLFGKSDEENRRRWEVQKRILEAQESYQKELVDQGRRQENLVDEAAQRQIRIAQIQSQQRRVELQRQLNAGTISREQFEEAIRQEELGLSATTRNILSGRAEAKASELGITGGAADAAEFVDEAAQVQFETQNLLTAITAARQLLIDGGTSAVPSAVKIINDALSKNNKATANAKKRATDLISLAKNFTGGRAGLNLAIAQFDRSGAVSSIRSEISTLGTQLENSQEVIDLLSRITDEELKTESLLGEIAQNTAKTAENTLPELRNRNVVSVFGRFVQSAGFQSIAPNVGLPDSVGTAIVQAERSKSISEQMFSIALETLNVNREQLLTLKDIFAVLDNNANTTARNFTAEQFAQSYQEFTRRGI